MSSRKLVVPPGMENLVERFGYAPGVVVGNVLRVSGQVGRNSKLEVVEGVEEQITQAFRNVELILETAGFAWTEVIELETWCQDLQRDLPTVLKVKQQFLAGVVTTWTGFSVSGFSMPGILFEVKVTAIRGA